MLTNLVSTLLKRVLKGLYIEQFILAVSRLGKVARQGFAEVKTEGLVMVSQARFYCLLRKLPE